MSVGPPEVLLDSKYMEFDPLLLLRLVIITSSSQSILFPDQLDQLFELAVRCSPALNDSKSS